MCGIIAALNLNNQKIDKDLFIRMRDTMHHRGPDDAGIYIDGPVALGHRRLSIIDLSETGHQPMANEDQTVWLIFNGEIYNYLELRPDLEKKGHRFHSTSDSEVILHQYEEDGEECVNKFIGMFSFVIWDGNKKRLFGARDRLGIKPLYYFKDGKKIVLGSEIKAIVEDPEIPTSPDYQGIADYFFAGRSLAGKTVFGNIKELEPGYTLLFDRDRETFQIRKYWDLAYNYDDSRSDEKIAAELTDLLSDAVRIHCRSDAPLGCHLSGGLDTSTVVGLAARHRSELTTFSIKFSDDDYWDETRYAKSVARHVGAAYYESHPEPVEFTSHLPFLLWTMDVPMAAPGAFGYYAVSRLAQHHVKVSLTGHGGDEIFGGYPGQFKAAFNRTDMFSTANSLSTSRKASLFRRFLNRILTGDLNHIFTPLKNRLRSEPRTLEDKWIWLHCGRYPNDRTFFHKEFIEKLQGYSPVEDYLRPFKEIKLNNDFDKCLYHDIRIYLPSLLHLEDRASMAVSLESRVPLLDHRILEYLATISPEQKVKGLRPKHLLREVASRVVPREIAERNDKIPFKMTKDFWLTKELQEMKRQLLLSHDALKRDIFQQAVLKRACESEKTEWALVNMELWFRIFIEKDHSWIDRVNQIKKNEH